MWGQTAERSLTSQKFERFVTPVPMVDASVHSKCNDSLNLPVSFHIITICFRRQQLHAIRLAFYVITYVEKSIPKFLTANLEKYPFYI